MVQKQPDLHNLTPTEAAARIGVAVTTLTQWRHRGKGPRWLKLGPGRSARIRYPSADLDSWLASCAATR